MDPVWDVFVVPCAGGRFMKPSRYRTRDSDATVWGFRGRRRGLVEKPKVAKLEVVEDQDTPTAPRYRYVASKLIRFLRRSTEFGVVSE